jgi:hypothetical protein
LIGLEILGLEIFLGVTEPSGFTVDILNKSI